MQILSAKVFGKKWLFAWPGEMFSMVWLLTSFCTAKSHILPNFILHPIQKLIRKKLDVSSHGTVNYVWIGICKFINSPSKQIVWISWLHCLFCLCALNTVIEYYKKKYYIQNRMVTMALFINICFLRSNIFFFWQFLLAIARCWVQKKIHTGSNTQLSWTLSCVYVCFLVAVLLVQILLSQNALNTHSTE